MANKPIVSIPIDDAKFKSFLALYEKYQTTLAKMPEAWKAASAEQDHLMKGFQAISSALMAHADLSQNVVDSQHRGTAEVERQAGFWRTIARSSKESVANVENLTRSVIRWTGLTTLFTGLLGGGSLWGFTHLAGDVAAMRQSAAGLGITPGQQTAFGLGYGRFLSSPGNALSSVAAALTDPTNPAYVPIAALLGNVQGHNAADVTSALMRRLPQLFPGGANQQNLGTLAGAYGLTNIMSVEDIKRYLSAGPDERAKQEGIFRSGQTKYNLSAKETLAYQDFETTLDSAGKSIFKTFVDGLEPLVQGGEGGSLGKLSQAAVRLVETFMGAVKDKDWIGSLSTGLEGISKAIQDGKLEEGVKAFVDDLEALGRGIKWLLSWVPGAAPSNEPVIKSPSGFVMSGTGKTGIEYLADFSDWLAGPERAKNSPWRSSANAASMDTIMSGLVARGFSQEQAAAIVGNLAAESSLNPANVNPASGAFGLEQLLGQRKGGFMRYAAAAGKNPTDIDAQLDWLKLERTGGSMQYGGTDERGAYQRAFSSGNVGGMAADFGKYVERPSDAELASSKARRQQMAYAAMQKGYHKEPGLNITVVKPTGSDPAVSIQQLPTGGASFADRW
jgi:hypothetical protein